MTMTESRTQGRSAPDLYGAAWLNGEPYALRRGEGDVVLVDFWSSTCVHCLTDLPHLNSWQQKYGEAGLVVIGVHSPEYEFAQSSDHVEGMIRAHDLAYRVVLDNKGSIRASYGVESLPTKALIDRNGVVRYVLYGRSDFLEFERAIQHLLREGGYHGELPSLYSSLDDRVQNPHEADVELRCGYLRGSLGNREGYAPESPQIFQDPGLLVPGRVFLRGAWFSGRESLRCLPRESADTAMRVVMGSGDLYLISQATKDDPVSVLVEVNGAPVPLINQGADLRKRKGGGSSLRIDSPRVYHVLKGLMERMNDVALIPQKEEVEFFQVSIIGSGDIRAIFPN